MAARFFGRLGQPAGALKHGHGATAEQGALQELASRRVIVYEFSLRCYGNLADEGPYVVGVGQGPGHSRRCSGSPSAYAASLSFNALSFLTESP
jgi:hypothetical protein